MGKKIRNIFVKSLCTFLVLSSVLFPLGQLNVGQLNEGQLSGVMARPLQDKIGGEIM